MFPTKPPETTSAQKEFENIVTMFNASSTTTQSQQDSVNNPSPASGNTLGSATSFTSIKKKIQSRKFKITRKKMVYTGSGYGTASKPKKLDMIKRIKLEEDTKDTEILEKKLSGTAQTILDVLRDSTSPIKAAHIPVNPYLEAVKEPERVVVQVQEEEPFQETKSSFISHLSLVQKSSKDVLDSSSSKLSKPATTWDLKASEKASIAQMPSFSKKPDVSMNDWNHQVKPSFGLDVTKAEEQKVTDSPKETIEPAVVPTKDKESVIESIRHLNPKSLTEFEFQDLLSTQLLKNQVGQQVLLFSKSDLPEFDFVNASSTCQVKSIGWTCQVCLVPNTDQAKKCIACESERTPSTNTVPSHSLGSLPLATNSLGWTCQICLVPNKQDAKKCIACESDQPGSTSKNMASIPSMPVPPVSNFTWGSFS